MRPRALIAWTVLACAVALPASAQVFETAGTRALGMGGAFVAVADDATAVYWNPAGLATGAYFSLLFDRVRDEALDDEEEAGMEQPGARRGTTSTYALSTPVLGIAHYRLQQGEIARIPTSGDASTRDRQDQGSEVQLQALTTRHTAVAVAQTLWPGFVAGAAAKWVRGVAVTERTSGRPAAGALLDRIDDLVARAGSTIDLDIGAMLTAGRARVGVVVRNLRRPRFKAPGGDVLELARQARVGAAFTDGLLTLAIDADLTRTATASGDRRSVALGGERWLSRRRLAFRAGLRVETVGERRPVGAAGGSVMLRSRVYADGQLTRGARGSDRGWSVATRVAF